jgi:mercuric ion transport protein
MEQKQSNLLMIGGVLSAIGASICCVGPLLLLLLGVSGSWIANLTTFEPYRPIFFLFVLLSFGYSGWKIYRPIGECEPDTACSVIVIQQRRKITFWLSALMVIVLVTSSYWILWFV